MTHLQHDLPPAAAIIRLGEHLRHDLEGFDRDPGAIGASLVATSALGWLRAALAAGDPDVAEALDVPSLLAAAKAEALRGAADKWHQGDWIMVLPASLGPRVVGLGQRVTDWIRAQAERTVAP